MTRRAIAISLVISSLFLAGFAAVPTAEAAATWTRVEARDVQGGRATVAWSTDVPTTGVVRYGTSADNLDRFLGDSQLRNEHEARLIGLAPRTRYYYAVTARDGAGAEVASFTFSFVTASKLSQAEEDERDANRAQASTTNDRVGVDGVAATVAALSWSSSGKTRGTVQYAELGSTRRRTTARTALGTEHQVLIKGLKPATTYEYSVTMRDGDGDVVSVRGPFRFTTAELRTQEETALTVAYLGPASTNDSRLSPTAATVQFTTNHLANATVTYRAKSNRRVAADGTLQLKRYGFQQQVRLSDLKPNTEYEVAITARDAFGKTLKLAAQKFRTPGLGQAAVTPRVAGASDTPAGRLVKAAGASTVYYVYPSGRKKPFASESAFFSYGHRFADVQVVSAQQLAAIPDVQLLKSTTAPTVYRLEGATLRPIVGEAAFLRAGYRWQDVELANPTDVQSYPLGTPIS